MAVEYCVADTFGLSPTAGTYVYESRRSNKQGYTELLDDCGEFVDIRSKKVKEVDVNINGKGDANFAAVTTGNFTANAVKAIEAEGSETNDGEYREFEMVGKGWFNPE